MHRCYKQAVIMMAAVAVVLSHAGAQSVRSTTSSYPYDIGGSFSPPVKIILAMLIFGMFFIAFLSLYIRKCLEHSSGETRQTLPIVNNRRGSRLKFPSGLDRSVVESFPVFVYSDVKKLKIEKGALECAVCISEFSDDERLRILPKCHHVFHPNCIDAWLASHITCPVCRADLTKAKLNADSVFNHELTQSEIEGSRTETESQNHNLVQVEEEHREITKFSRSHSTGHSLVSPGENCERYTLRLPEEVWRQIVTLKRAKSCGCGVDENSKRGRRWNPDRICGRSPVTLMPVFIGKTNSVGKTDPAQSSGTASLPV